MEKSCDVVRGGAKKLGKTYFVIYERPLGPLPFMPCWIFLVKYNNLLLSFLEKKQIQMLFFSLLFFSLLYYFLFPFFITIFTSFFLIFLSVVTSHHLCINYYVPKLGGLGLNENKLKWNFSTHGNWKNQNPMGRFGATSKTAPLIQPIWPIFAVNGLFSR